MPNQMLSQATVSGLKFTYCILCETQIVMSLPHNEFHERPEIMPNPTIDELIQKWRTVAEALELDAQDRRIQGMEVATRLRIQAETLRACADELKTKLLSPTIAAAGGANSDYGPSIGCCKAVLRVSA